MVSKHLWQEKQEKMNFSFVVLISVCAKKYFINTSLTPVLETYKIVIDFNTFNQEYTKNFVLMT